MNETKQRLKKLQTNLQTNGIKSLVITDIYAISYYLNIEFDPYERYWLLLVPAEGQPTLIANELFVFEQPEDVRVIWVKDSESLVSAFERGQLLAQLPSGAHIAVDQKLLAGWLMPLMIHYPQFHWELDAGLVDQQRGVKSAAEVAALREVAAITDRAMGRMIKEVIPQGLPEIQAANQLARIFKEEGANQGYSFDPIVAYGANGADPHHEPDDSLPQMGDAVVIDIGCRHNFYCSDMTRTVFYGEPNAKAREVFETVKKAQDLGVAAVKVGEPLKAVDLAGRNYIEAAGYGKYFTHRIGHFIGRECHEKGDVSSVNTTPIQANNAFSVEPGIYLPGETATRIEDIVVAGPDGAERLNHYPRDYQVVTPQNH